MAAYVNNKLPILSRICNTTSNYRHSLREKIQKWLVRDLQANEEMENQDQYFGYQVNGSLPGAAGAGDKIEKQNDVIKLKNGTAENAKSGGG